MNKKYLKPFITAVILQIDHDDLGKVSKLFTFKIMIRTITKGLIESEKLGFKTDYSKVQEITRNLPKLLQHKSSSEIADQILEHVTLIPKIEKLTIVITKKYNEKEIPLGEFIIGNTNVIYRYFKKDFNITEVNPRKIQNGVIEFNIKVEGERNLIIAMFEKYKNFDRKNLLSVEIKEII